MWSNNSLRLRAPLLAFLALSALAGPAVAQAPSGDVRIHYYRPDGNYSGWGLYAWNASTATYSWCSSEVAPTGTDSFGIYFDVPVSGTAGSPAGQLGFIINNCANNGAKDPGPNQYLQVTEYTQAWVISGNLTVFYSQPATVATAIPSGDVRLHYRRPDATYTGWALYGWNAIATSSVWCSSEVPITGVDSFGVYFDVPVTPSAGSPAGQLGFIINNCDNGQIKDPGANQYLQVTQYSEAWILSGDSTVYTTEPNNSSIPPGDVRIHYYRPDGNYSGWGLYAWNAATTNYAWCSSQVAPAGTDSFGIYFDVPVSATAGSPAGQLGFIINNCANNGAKDPGPDQHLQVSEYSQAWVVSGNVTVFYSQPAVASTEIPSGSARIHYHRPDGNYTGWALYGWNATTATYGWCTSEVPITGVDSFGVYFDVPVTATAGSPAGQLGFIINNCDNQGAKDPGSNQYLQVTQYDEGWVLSGDATVYTTEPDMTALPPGDVRIHYYRPDGNYAGWGLYAWNAATTNYNWCQNQVAQSGTDSFGVYFDVPVSGTLGTPPGQLGFIINNCGEGGAKDPGPNQYLQVTQYTQAWVISGDVNVFTTQPTAGQIAGAGLYQRQAFWIDRTTVAIPASAYKSSSAYSLVYSLSAGLSVSSNGVLSGGTSIPLTYVSTGLTAAEAAQSPQLASYAVFHIAGTTPLSALKQALTGQVVVAGTGANGSATYLNGLQDAGVLDDLFYYSGALGPVFARNGLTISVWAPTAQSVTFLLYTNANDTTPAQTIPMKATNGVWSIAGQRAWKGQYFLYDVKVYDPETQQIVDNLVTDPYSADISLNGGKTKLTDLNDDAVKPAGWDESSSPWISSKNDLSLYELHVREFSVGDASVPEEYRGTYLAFTDPNTNGMRHLRRLAMAGLKAVHIMPSMHIASVNEDKSTWKSPGDLSSYPPDGTQQQAAIAAVQSQDGYNFGYDPVHYFAPNGGFAFNPDNRVLEYRQMVKALHNAGLRVVQDVVFNHTSAYGLDPNSVLDKIVPGYYYRLDANGNVDTASCCYDTASEHRMFEKLMIDNVVQNAVQYKIDGFRFDDMSLHFVSNMQHIQQALARLTPWKDGVDGSKIYVYGEGWFNPESAAVGTNATQANLYGTGIGTFNDRIRDGIRGGSAPDTSSQQVQGFATGLFTDPSTYTTNTLNETPSQQHATLLSEADWIRIGLAGNLRDFTFVDSAGDTVKASDVIYGGQPAGYTASPLEDVNYCSVHDNQPLFDAIQLKAAIPGTTANGGDSSTVRARRQAFAMSIIALGQGVPFFLSGDDILRSKDMDNNSYDSGDWFNKIEWPYEGDRPTPKVIATESDNWGVGLPMASQNQAQWPAMQPLLANPALKPSPSDIALSATAFQMFLRIRSSSALFHMATLAEVQNNLHFLNTGPSQIPGVIVMKLDANQHDYGPFKHIVVVFNGTLGKISFQNQQLKGMRLMLHPEELTSSDAATRGSAINNLTGTATVAGLTTAVFVSRN